MQGKAPRGIGEWAVAEHAGINLYSEQSLHQQLKEALAEAGDRFEVPVDGRVVDLVKADGELVEVQTSGLAKLWPKVLALAASGRAVRVVYPVLAETRIRRLDPRSGEVLSERRSPKRGAFWEVFDELVWATRLVAAPNVSLEVVLVNATLVRTRDGSGSWRRRGDRTVDRLLDRIVCSRRLTTPREWLSLVPPGLEAPWSSATLGRALGVTPARARQVLYCLAKAGLLVEHGRDGARKLYSPMATRHAGRAARR